MGQTAESRTAKIQREDDKTPVKRRLCRNKEVRTPKSREKTGRYLLGALGGAVFLAVIAGAYIWGYLNATQAGGIVFLLVGIVGYASSMEKKHTRTVQEKIRNREEKADQKYMEKKAASAKGTLPGTAERVLSKSEEENILTEKGEELIGATTVLREGEGEYEPHLGLISMNPRERNSVVLLKDSYVIGKMKAKSDIYIDDPSISRVHAQIRKEGDQYYLCDLNSTNGTFINGERLPVNEKVPIHLSDEIAFAGLGYYVGKC